MKPMAKVALLAMLVIVTGCLAGCPRHHDPELPGVIDTDPGYVVDPPGSGDDPGTGTTTPGGDTTDPGDYIDPIGGDEPGNGITPGDVDCPECFEVFDLPDGFNPFDIQTREAGGGLVIAGHNGSYPDRRAAALTWSDGQWCPIFVNSEDEVNESYLLSASLSGKIAAGTGVWCLCDGTKIFDTGTDVVAHLLGDGCGVGWSAGASALYWDGWSDPTVLSPLVEGKPAAALALAVRNNRTFRFGVVTDRCATMPATWYPSQWGILLDPSTMPPVSDGAWVNCATPDGLRTGGGYLLPEDNTVYALLEGADDGDYGYNCHQVVDVSGNRLPGQLRDIVIVCDVAFGVGGPDNVMTEIGGPIDLPANTAGEAIVTQNGVGYPLAVWLAKFGVATPEPIRTLRAIVPCGDNYLLAVGVTESGNGIMLKIPRRWSIE